MGSGKDQCSLRSDLCHLGETSVRSIRTSLDVFLAQGQTGNTIHDQVLTGQSTSFIKAGNVNLAGEGNAERLGTEDGILAQSGERCVDSQAEFHRKLWRND